MPRPSPLFLLLSAALSSSPLCQAAVSAAEAAQLDQHLTPLGAERAGNAAGTIPAWNGGLRTATPGFQGGRRPDPYAEEKPILQITAQNMAQYTEQLSEGVRALLKRYPESFRLDVYPTHRSAAAPQWVYDNIRLNATRAQVVQTADGPVSQGAYGGIPFPIPQNGTEVMLNAQVRWRGTSYTQSSNAWQATAHGKLVLVHKAIVDNLSPYYYPEGQPDSFEGAYWMVRANMIGPPQRAGEAVLAHMKVDESQTRTWTYLVGQRRVRMVPNACCDAAHAPSAGLVLMDEVEGFNAKLDRFDWQLIGKKELYIPYNSNRLLLPEKDIEVLGAQHLNPDHVRWELHRVWVVEATLAAGKRHLVPRSRYYIDEDTWWPVLADRWDSQGRLSRMPFSIPVAMPDIPAQIGAAWGTYDLINGGYLASQLMNEAQAQYTISSPRLKEDHFATESLGAEGIR
jgi:hypothetical protein